MDLVEEDPEDSIGNRVDKVLTPSARKQMGRLRQMAETRERVQHQCLTQSARTDDPQHQVALLGVYAKLDSAAIKQVEVENNLMGLYDVVAPGVGGKSLYISFDGGNLNITNNTQINEAKDE
jgi:hypothetical protein